MSTNSGQGGMKRLIARPEGEEHQRDEKFKLDIKYGKAKKSVIDYDEYDADTVGYCLLIRDRLASLATTVESLFKTGKFKKETAEMLKKKANELLKISKSLYRHRYGYRYKGSPKNRQMRDLQSDLRYKDSWLRKYHGFTPKQQSFNYFLSSIMQVNDELNAVLNDRLTPLFNVVESAQRMVMVSNQLLFDLDISRGGMDWEK